MGEKRRLQLNSLCDDITYLKQQMADVKAILQLILEIKEMIPYSPQSIPSHYNCYYDLDFKKTVELLEEKHPKRTIEDIYDNE